MSAWLSFLGGYAKGANEEIDKQREKEEQYIQDRMKMAAATRLQKQKEAETQRKELEEARGTLSAIPSFASAKPAQQIALLASPVIRKQFVDRTNAGEVVDLDKLMEVNADALKAYPTVDSYIQSFKAKPKAVDEQTMSAFKQPKQVFGATTGTSMEGLEQNAARFGMKPEEALGWEQGGEELPSMGGFATLKPEALMPTDLKGRTELVETKLFQAKDAIKRNDPAGDKMLADALADYAAVREVQQLMKGDEYIEWSKQRDRLRSQLMATTDPEKEQELTRQLNRMARIDRIGEVDKSAAERIPSTAALTAGAKGAAAAAIQMYGGEKAIKGLVIEPGPDGSPQWKYTGDVIDLQNRLREIGNKAMRAFYAQYESNPAARQNISLSREAVGLGQAERQQLEAQAEARKATGGAPLANNPPPKTMRPAAAPNPLTGRGGVIDAAMLPDQIQTMPPRPAKVTPPTAKPAAGDTTAPPVSMLKNGVNTTFENGQVWTLKNGVATRIK